jgi:hypothetical protein
MWRYEANAAPPPPHPNQYHLLRMILMRANPYRGPLEGVDPENRDFFGPRELPDQNHTVRFKRIIVQTRLPVYLSQLFYSLEVLYLEHKSSYIMTAMQISMLLKSYKDKQCALS